MRFWQYSIIFVVLFILGAGFVQAQNLQNAFGDNSITNQVADRAGYEGEVAPETIVGRIINVALSLIGVVFLALMVYGGYLWMTDRGNSQQVEKAKKLISAAIIGLVIVVSAYAITYFIVSALQEETLQMTSIIYGLV